MNQKELEAMLAEHLLWIRDPHKGKMANLRGANLREASLRGANLREASLRGADLREADLREADLYGASLYGADLREADLRWANLREANLRGADLRGANLRWADLYGASLRGADLYGASLYEANLYGANLREANLRGADLYGANLRGANLREIIVDYTTIGVHPAPEGDLIGWGWKGGKLVKMLIPANAKRSCATTRKHRAEYVKVLEVAGAEQAVVINGLGTTVYEPGKTVKAHAWDDNRWNECAPGIHFFLTKEEAETWGRDS